MRDKDYRCEIMVVIEETVRGIERRVSDLLTKCGLDSFVDVKKIEKWISNIELGPEGKSEIYSYSSKLEKLHEALEEAEEIGINKNPAIKYYEFLKRYEINFATESEVNAECVDLIQIGPEDFFGISESEFQSTKKTNQKIGRNASCPCGSGKKYKKCCLRNKAVNRLY